MSRTSKTLGFSVPPALIKEVETIAKKERRTKSELFREMFRVYRRYSQQRDSDEARWVAKAIEEAKQEEAKSPMTVGEVLSKAGAWRSTESGRRRKSASKRILRA
jgi:metal-responsive CopG/Arc/MetJ family transcriptional regulator